jgi:hypothetical protein
VDVKDDEAKLLCLWFNSTINLLQTLLTRKETRGAFLQLDEYALEEALVPDFENIERGTIGKLLDVFDGIKDVRFPSILEQLEQEFSAREKIDKAILMALGFDEHNISLTLPKLYIALAEEIKLLKQLMAGRFVEED